MEHAHHALPHRAAAKIKPDWQLGGGVITGGEIYRVSPAIISSYFQYMTTEYAQYATSHGMLLIQLAGPRRGEPWSADAARGMLRRAGRRAGLPGRIKPQAFRHQITNDVLDASGGDAIVAKVVGNWASARMVDEVYGHPDLHSPEFVRALHAAWGAGGGKTHEQGATAAAAPDRWIRLADRRRPAGGTDLLDRGTVIRPALPRRRHRDAA
ncbi:tyrosine-type recombinase/integrase [Streptomyces sp. WM6378]|uniref:tyrosine-type recombinase/integrase n=1 Tax=Streptomyces sp. WM6378 TaxID=1415557 RepID=UPI000A4050E6|nr:tyrosine-type recombinase/integrase [Streptomyces sp. WM6378]